MDKRYARNMNMLTPEENQNLQRFRVCVVGCGGLGGYVIEMLGRLGIGHITAIDGDVFEESNLNRQLLSDTETIGFSKAETARRRMQVVNPLIQVRAVQEHITAQNGEDQLRDHDVVVDALDNVESRFVLRDVCAHLGLPLVHGAIGGWYGQVTTILPGDNTLDLLYPKEASGGIEKILGNPSFAPGLVASIQVSEVLKILIGRGQLLQKRLLHIDLYSQEYSVLELKD